MFTNVCVRGRIAFENKGLLNGMLLLKKIVHGLGLEYAHQKILIIKPLQYCPSFHEDGARITVHLDMNKRTCVFTVNGKKYREVSEWNNLPSTERFIR
ncbi:20818_t:CDS:2, partial [Rhizophagus irregularis]